MNGTRLLTIGVVGVLLVGGLAGLGAATPADAPADNTHADDPVPEHVGDESDVNETEGVGDRADAPGADAATEDRPGAVGPSDGLPSAVPDHVHAIHDRIESFLDDSVKSFGLSLNELVSGDDAGYENSDSL